MSVWIVSFLACQVRLASKWFCSLYTVSRPKRDTSVGSMYNAAGDVPSGVTEAIAALMFAASRRIVSFDEFGFIKIMRAIKLQHESNAYLQEKNIVQNNICGKRIYTPEEAAHRSFK